MVFSGQPIYRKHGDRNFQPDHTRSRCFRHAYLWDSCAKIPGTRDSGRDCGMPGESTSSRSDKEVTNTLRRYDNLHRPRGYCEWHEVVGRKWSRRRPASARHHNGAVPGAAGEGEMMRAGILAWVVGGPLICSLAAATAQQPQPGRQGPAPQTQPSGPQHVNSAVAMTTRGELKFHQNCGRCHNAPQELSPRTSGTVMMHMRVRASLSEADAKAILHYLAP